MTSNSGVDNIEDPELAKESSSPFPFNQCNNFTLVHDSSLLVQSLQQALHIYDYVLHQAFYVNVDLIQEFRRNEIKSETTNEPCEVISQAKESTRTKLLLKIATGGANGDETKAVFEALINETMNLETEPDKSISNYVINSLLLEHEFANLKLSKAQRLNDTLKTSLKRRIKDLYIDTYLNKMVFSFFDGMEDQFLLLSNSCLLVCDPGWFPQYCNLFRFDNQDYLYYDIAFFDDMLRGPRNKRSSLDFLANLADKAFCLNLVHFMACYAKIAKSLFNLLDFDQFDSSSDDNSIYSINRRLQQDRSSPVPPSPKIKFDMKIYIKTFDEREPPHIVSHTTH